MDPVRVGLFGVTHPHSIAHLKTLQVSSLVSGIVLFDDDANAVAQVAEDFGDKIEATYSDLSQLLRTENFSIGIADFETHRNADLCLRLIDQGVHILSEKPIAINSEKLEQVVTAAAAANLRLGVMYQNRLHPTAVEARRLVGQGMIGRPTGCEARLITSQVRFRNPEHWLFDREKSGGGMLSWLACHTIDLLTYVLSDDITEVSAITDTLSGEDIDVEDVASVSFRFRSGLIGSIQAGYQLSMSRQGYMGPNYEGYIGFRGTQGRLFWIPFGGAPTLHAESIHPRWQGAPVRTIDFELPDLDCYGGSYGLQFLEAFLRSTRGEGEPPASGQDALKMARIIEAAYESSESGMRVKV